MTAIPRLAVFCFAGNDFHVSSDFAVGFVKLHGEDWTAADRHWVNIVGQVLKTDAVAPNATGDTALRQAVTASVALLSRTYLRDRCPLCLFDVQGEAA